MAAYSVARTTASLASLGAAIASKVSVKHGWQAAERHGWRHCRVAIACVACMSTDKGIGEAMRAEPLQLKTELAQPSFVGGKVVRGAGGGGTATQVEELVPRRIPNRKKRRLDEVCVERCPQYSRTIIQSWILQGKVLVDGRPAAKAGMQVADSADIEIIAQVPRYVCRAGLKLEAALQQLCLDVHGKVVLDAGLSTGGFADCLLQHGAAKIFGVDVGYGQVAEKIRTDERVIIMERTNLRYLEELPELVDLVTLDLSFISILKVMPAVCRVMKPDAELVVLIKPQFEARRDQVGGGGIVRSTKVHEEVVTRVVNGIVAYGFNCAGKITSPITGAEGNVEFLSYFKRAFRDSIPRSESDENAARQVLDVVQHFPKGDTQD